MKIFIKNMVCDRCIAAVAGIFEKLDIRFKDIRLGEVETEADILETDWIQIENKLEEIGFEIIKNPSQQLIENIKNLIILKIGRLDTDENFVLSNFLSIALHKDYSSLSKVFSQNENFTLEQYYILQKIEKVKELLFNNDFTLTEIAGHMGYKSVQHLSSQFKTTTGYTPTEFKKLEVHNRKPLDQV
ncbi:helix-turn-helix domain-containing protein [Chryseobacterium chendengshani]|uniref:helix-turn-helix domain-containing protein n=1 Tax=unclassified Chryseobacterium TaxID=2593645 RepID=UPI001C63DFC5|nr:MULTISPECIES: helix-turn-helix domain-containing protein [unclassified Chryseobacterium]MBW7674425.1 helix-turn-helix domain-containing protein [Chryseobacterium sp. LJ756]MBW8522787.1 helix-turn-helix domain-containing protein [Chryseobacterium sp. LJ668]QYK16319.1 helix-turn-helix domain-containing protein [Chryseobacterium sp. LJ668]